MKNIATIPRGAYIVSIIVTLSLILLVSAAELGLMSNEPANGAAIYLMIGTLFVIFVTPVLTVLTIIEAIRIKHLTIYQILFLLLHIILGLYLAPEIRSFSSSLFNYVLY